MPAVKDVGEPCAGEPHARFDGGREETGASRPRRAEPGASRLPDTTSSRAGQHRVRLSRRPDAAGHGEPEVDRAHLDRDLGRRQRLARERRAEDRWTFGPATYRARTPTLLLVGSASPPRAHQATEIARQALPNSRVNLLDGQAHAAASNAPELLSHHIAWFLADEPPPSRQAPEMPSTRRLR
jgi:hypothetical protein